MVEKLAILAALAVVVIVLKIVEKFLLPPAFWFQS
jgi:hypothetical protein